MPSPPYSIHMPNVVNKIRRKYRRDGLLSLLKAIINRVIITVKRSYYKLRGKRIEIDGQSAVFNISTNTEISELNWVIDNESSLLQDIIKELDHDDVYWDVGAHIGVHAIYAANNLPNGKVIAFEPYPPNRESLEQNAQMNKVDIQIENIALSDSNGETEFSQPESSEPGNQWGAIIPDSVSPTDIQSRSVARTARGDGLVSNKKAPAPDVVKIDVEGASPLVIEGMKSTLSNESCRICYCEAHFPEERYENSRPSIQDHGFEIDDIKRMLSEIGFDVEILEERERDIQIKAVK